MKGFQKLLSERPAYIKRNAIPSAQPMNFIGKALSGLPSSKRNAIPSAQPMRGFQKFLSEKPYKRNKTLLG
jgi:hypothetical protein